MPMEAAFFFNSGSSMVESPPDFLAVAELDSVSAVIVESVTWIRSSFRDGEHADQTACVVFRSTTDSATVSFDFLEG